LFATPLPSRDLRAPELDQIVGLLAARRPAVITVCGPPGMGKTSLLRAVRDRAVTRGWVVAGGAEGSRVAVDATMQRHNFMTAVLRAAGQSREATGGPSTAPPARRDVRGGRMDPFVEELCRRAPLVVLIDDYRPNPLFEAWFEGTFLPDVRASRSPLVVCVAQRALGRRLEPLATHVVQLGPLDPKLVRRRLLMLDGLEPPLSDDELDVYCREAETPLLLESLMRVLSLASRGEGRR
jgi:hypothetical protein